MPRQIIGAVETLLEVLGAPEGRVIVNEYWVTRGKCRDCGKVLWSQPGAPNVRCHTTFIQDDILHDGDPVTDEEHKAAAAFDHGTTPDRIALVNVTGT